MLCYGPLVSELGGPECMVPQPRHWGACAPPRPSGSAAYATLWFRLVTTVELGCKIISRRFQFFFFRPTRESRSLAESLICCFMYRPISSKICCHRLSTATSCFLCFCYGRSVKTPSYQGLKFLSDLLQLKETAILSDSDPDLASLHDSPTDTHARPGECLLTFRRAYSLQNRLLNLIYDRAGSPD